MTRQILVSYHRAPSIKDVVTFDLWRLEGLCFAVVAYHPLGELEWRHTEPAGRIYSANVIVPMTL